MDDIGLDSLDLVEFVMVLEDHFEIEVCILQFYDFQQISPISKPKIGQFECQQISDH